MCTLAFIGSLPRLRRRRSYSSGPTCETLNDPQGKMTLLPHTTANNADPGETNLTGATKRLATSTEVKFTIIYEQSNDLKSFDEDTDTDSESTQIFSRSFMTTTSTEPLTVDFPTQCPTSLPPPNFLQPPARIAAANRFRITRNDTNPAVCLKLNPDKPISKSSQGFLASKVSSGPSVHAPAFSERSFKCGRWTCAEGGFNEKKKNLPTVINNVAVPALPLITPTSVLNNNTTTHLNESAKQHLVHEKAFFSFESKFPEDANRKNVVPSFTKEPEQMETLTNLPSFDLKLMSSQRREKFYANSTDYLSTPGCVTPLEMQLHGLEWSLSEQGSGQVLPPGVSSVCADRGSSVPSIERFDKVSQLTLKGFTVTPVMTMTSSECTGDRSATPRTPSSAPASKKNSSISGSKFGGDSLVLLSKESFLLHSVGNANSSQAVAIDCKIEQAMDLVKTHLMFAVREEVDFLRSKILELETTAFKLETENSILREHVPNEVLQSLNGVSTNSGAQGTNSTVLAAQ